MNRILTIASLVLCLIQAGPVRTVMGQVGGEMNPHGETLVDLDCRSCHTNDRWIPARSPMLFQHDTDTRFKLTGRHTGLSCFSCHPDWRFDLPGLDGQNCSTCHLDVHDASLSSDCSSCHSTQQFSDVDALAVHASTLFPLSGTHQIITCESCHSEDLGGAYSTVDSDCIACHERNYDETVSIPHVEVGYSTNCQDCHTALGWTFGVDFDHLTASNGFELVGAHKRIECTSCHTSSSFELLVPSVEMSDCYGCHAQDYDREHSGGEFSTVCTQCHSTDSWEDAEFTEHDQIFFPIFSGKHRGEWDSCETCHLDPGTFQVFSCFDCHEHNRSDTDDEHREESGYVYDSLNCLSCHPAGRAEDD